jgi:ribosome assembly protein YihI (activator of Der GTPase)
MLHKIPTAEEQKQMDLQKQAALTQTRYNLSSVFLNTLMGRQDADLTADDMREALVDISVDYADALLVKLGIIPQKA